MPKLKVQNRFGIIPNDLLNNPNITLKSKGLFGYLQSKPDDWDFSADRIKNDTKENRDAILSGLKELEHFGYLQRNRYKEENGQWGVDYILHDTPCLCVVSSVENPQWQETPASVENPTQENPTQENPTLNKEINTKKETVNKKYKREDFLTGNEYLDIKVGEWIEKGTFTIYIDDPFLNAKMMEFVESRKQLKKPMTPLAIEKLVAKILGWFESKRYTNIQIGTFFDRSIECGWQGVFQQGFATQYRMQQKNEYEKQGARKDFVFSNNQ